MRRRVAIIGTGQTKCVTTRRDMTAPDLIFEATKAALLDAGLEAQDVEAVVFAMGPEAFEGVNNPDKWCSGAAGGLHKATLRVNTGGATGGSAANEATYLVSSGLFDVVVAAGLERVGETPDAQVVLSKVWDPLISEYVPMNIIVSNAVRATRNMERYGYTEYHMAMVSSKNHMNALNNPYAHIQKRVTVEDVLSSRVLCWPLKLLDCCPRSDGACTVIFASERLAKSSFNQAAWVLGTGGAATVTTPGETLPGNEFDIMNLREVKASRQAYKMAGISNPRRQVDVVEPYQPFSYQEPDSYHCLGFCEASEVRKLVESGFGEMTGEIPFSPSGGLLCSNPIGASGLIRVAEAAIQITGKGDKRQVPDVKIALATAAGGSPGPGSASFYTSMVLGVSPP